MVLNPVARIERIDFHGWAAWRLFNDRVSVVAVPELGGRVLSLKLADHEFLFMNSTLAGKRFTPEEHQGDGSLVSWKNYGGEKTWPAPQGWDDPHQWPGPPDPVLDSGIYNAEPGQMGTSVSLSMSSPPDARSGLRITRRLTLAPQTDRIQVDLSFENITERPVRWSIWDVMQINCAAPDGTLNDQMWMYIPTQNDLPYHVLYGEANDAQWQPEIVPGVLGVHYLGHVGKIGIGSNAGWLAVVDQAAERVLAVRFNVEPDAEYPDGGASVECWTESPGAPSPVPIQSPGYLLEAEVLGPLRVLQPGEHSHLALEWQLVKGGGHVKQVTNSEIEF